MFTLTIHNILNYDVPTLDKGTPIDIGKTRTLKGAQQRATKELGGDLRQERPLKIARITGPSEDSWWFMGINERVTYRGTTVTYVDRSLVICQHTGSIPTIQE